MSRILIIALVAMVVAGALIFGLTSLGILPEEFVTGMGNMLSEIPIVGIWIDGISSLPSMIHGNDLIVSTGQTALQILLRSLSSNIMDSLFLGLICYLIKIILQVFFPIETPRTKNTITIVSAIVGTILGVIALWLTKGGTRSQQFIYEILCAAIMVVGILIIIRRFNVGGTIIEFLFKIVSGGFASGCTVGFFTSVIMSVFLVQSGLHPVAIVFWFIMVHIFFGVGIVITIAAYQADSNAPSGSMGGIIAIGVALLFFTIVFHFIT